MSEWWTYALTDFLLFSPRTYYRHFELYNLAIWPAQIVSLGLGAVVAVLSYRGGAWAGRMVSAILAVGWLWVAWAFHLLRYTAINWAAGYFAAGFAIEAVLLIWVGIIRDRLQLRSMRNGFEWTGIGILLFALVAYPFIGPLLGRPWTQVEVFGVAADPTVIATLGIALLASPPRRTLGIFLAIPLLWCAIGGAILSAMKSPDALVMPLIALLVVFLALWKPLAAR